MKSRSLRNAVHGLLVGCWLALGAAAAFAIEIAPSAAQIADALERGKAAARDRVPPDHLYAWFGSSDELEPRGFVMTKLVGLTVMATHFALRGETPTEADIRRILDEQTCIVSVNLVGPTPAFARDTYMVLSQGGRTIKPVKVRFDGQAARTPVWPAMPAYRAKVVASFAYSELDPRAASQLSVFPGVGGEVTFELDLARID